MRPMKRLFLFLCLLCATSALWAAGTDDLLEPDKAFQFSARALDTGTLEVDARHKLYYEQCGNPDGKAVVLLKPSLPLALFDLCIIPEHDNPPHRLNIMAVRGVLNDVQTSAISSPDQGLMLIGGISSHFGWDDASVAAAVSKIALTTPQVRWQLTISRRTPPTFLASLAHPLPNNLTLVPHNETGSGWLEQALTAAGQVWVTEDSVSMLYEALTAGAGVGLLRLPDPRNSRVRRGVDELVAAGWVTPFEAWQPGLILPRLSVQFNEAERVSARLLNPLAATQ